MAVGFYDLLDRVSDQIRHHHYACPLVDQHTDEGVTEVDAAEEETGEEAEDAEEESSEEEKAALRER